MQRTKAILFDFGRTLFDTENNLLFPQTIDVLKYCERRYRLGLVSIARNGICERANQIAHLGLRKHFFVIRLGVENKDALYEGAVLAVGLPPEEITVVDDRIKRLGWPIKNKCRVIWLKKGKFADELPNEQTGFPSHIIENIAEVLKFV